VKPTQDRCGTVKFKTTVSAKRNDTLEISRMTNMHVHADQFMWHGCILLYIIIYRRKFAHFWTPSWCIALFGTWV